MLTVSSPAENKTDLVQSVRQHRAIVEAIAAHDARMARAAMQVVVQQGIDRSRR
jgi:DNA-binding GntR family transcriptional regulator